MMNKKYPLVIGALFLTATTSFAVGTTFTDEASFASWYKDAVKHMQETGVVTGYADGSFKAENPVTRGELSLMLDRYEEKIVQMHIKQLADEIRGDLSEEVEEDVEKYMQEYKEENFDSHIQGVIDNIERFDDSNIDYKTGVIMAASGLKKLDMDPNKLDHAVELQKDETANLPDNYEVYVRPIEEDALDNPYYLHYIGPVNMDEPEGEKADEWYGPF